MLNFLLTCRKIQLLLRARNEKTKLAAIKTSFPLLSENIRPYISEEFNLETFQRSVVYYKETLLFTLSRLCYKG